MKYYRITQYNPAFRNAEGAYLYDHWTEIGDVGRTLEGELVTADKYLAVESDYIQAVAAILKENSLEYLRVVGCNPKSIKHWINKYKDEWFHLPEFETIELQEDKKARIDEIRTICQMNLRGYCNISLEISGVFYVDFGYDMYMYVGAPNISDALRKKLDATSVFVEDSGEPYYPEKLNYEVLKSKKRSQYVLEEQVLEDFSVTAVRKILNLSDEHPGKVHAKINRKMAQELNLETDFEKYDYVLTSQGN